MYTVSHMNTGLCRISHGGSDLEESKKDAILYQKALFGTVHLLDENLKRVFRVDHWNPNGIDLS